MIEDARGFKYVGLHPKLQRHRDSQDGFRADMKLRLALITAATFLCINPASAAPAGILGKTIRISYGMFIPGKAADGSINPGGRKVFLTIYVSSAGRVFSKGINRAGRFGHDMETAPESNGNGFDFHFAGSTLVGVGVARNGNIAQQLKVNFDSGFQSCNAEVMLGSESGAPMSWVGLNGVSYTATGHPSISGVSCALEVGNAFAH